MAGVPSLTKKAHLTNQLKTAVENHFTAKPPRAQRTYSKNKSHPFGEAIDHLVFESNP
jgi:hypothetical protein